MKSFIKSNRIIKPLNTIPNYTFCNEKGYLEEKYFKKHPELYNKNYKRFKNSKNNKNNSKKQFYKIIKKLNNLKKSNRIYKNNKNNKNSN